MMDLQARLHFLHHTCIATNLCRNNRSRCESRYKQSKCDDAIRAVAVL